MIRYALTLTPLGSLLVAATERGVCRVAFVEGDDPSPVLQELERANPGTTVIEDEEAVAPHLRKALAVIEGDEDAEEPEIDVRGTPFQQRVWDAVRAIPRGSTRTYGEVARELGMEGAARAVGSACGANPVALFIPCHRVVRSGGGFGDYYWGQDRKRALL